MSVPGNITVAYSCEYFIQGNGGLPPVSNWLGFEKTRGPGRESDRPCRSSEEFTQNLFISLRVKHDTSGSETLLILL